MWIVLALLTAIFWGISYSCYAYMVGRISPYVVMLTLHGVGIWVYSFMAWRGGHLARDLQLVWTDADLRFWTAVAIIVTIIGNITILEAFRSTQSSPAIVSMIEITYPVFVAVFAWWWFGKPFLSPISLMGCVIMFAGAAVLVWGQK